jgi:hypothetical protein
MNHDDLAQLHQQEMTATYSADLNNPAYNTFYGAINDYQQAMTAEEVIALANRCIASMAGNIPPKLLPGYRRLVALCHWRAKQLQELESESESG